MAQLGYPANMLTRLGLGGVCETFLYLCSRIIVDSSSTMNVDLMQFSLLLALN